MLLPEKRLRSRAINASLLNVQRKWIRDLSALRVFGGTSITDALSFYRRRPDVDTEIVAFEDWMLRKSRKKSEVEEQLSFTIDFKDWLSTLGELEKKVLDYLMLGYKVNDICELLKMAYAKLKDLIHGLKISFLNFFNEPNGALT